MKHLLNAWLHPWWACGALCGAMARLINLSYRALADGYLTGYGDDDEPTR